MMGDVMVDALVAAVNGVAQAQRRDATAGTWQDVEGDVASQVSAVLRRLPATEIDLVGRELGVAGADRGLVEDAVLMRVRGLVTAALAA